ncbi:hypothetical protein SKAU_G00215840, partial [Synaphobranchus kaupii]
EVGEAGHAVTGAEGAAGVTDVIQQLLELSEQVTGESAQAPPSVPAISMETGINQDILQQALENSGLSTIPVQSHTQNGGAPRPGVATQNQSTEGAVAAPNKGHCSDKIHRKEKRSIYKKPMQMPGSIREENGVRWHVCPYCSKEFKKPSDLVRHIRIHTHEKPFKCKQCFRAFAVKSTLTAHMKTHTGIKAFECQCCRKCFSTSGSMKVHMRLHTGVRPFPCPHCDKIFRTSGHRKTHVASHFKSAQQKKQKGPRKPHKTRSARGNLPLPDIPLQEPILITDLGLVQNQNPRLSLQQYLDIVENDRPYKCHYCSKAYKKSSHLKQHVRQENGQKISKLCETTHLDNEVPEKVAGMEPDRESSPTDDNLRTNESRREIAPGLSAENASATQVASAKEIPCNECATSFSSLQKYMEHHCPNARLPLLKDENESEISDLEDSDVENLTGEIVYQPDGSAFILEDSKDSGQNAQPGAKSLFSPAMFPNSQTSAGDKTEQSAAAPMSFYPQAGFAFLKGSASSAASADQPLRSTQMPKAEINLGGLSASAMKAPIGSGSINHSSSGARDRDQESNCERRKDISTLHSNGEFPIKKKTKQTAAPRDSTNDTNNYSGSVKDYAEFSGGRDGTPPSYPIDLIRRDDESPGPPHQHIATPGTPGTGEGSPGSGVECPKCDTVLGSSRSLGGHMTMMHSRNSCKTLKCPKCNWHYKYQQTLDAHMKEKHPESGGSCAYCRTGQPHPRLARGESYTCGYKPFRCEVCNYSTTTKGNLSIHMQSDKHLNNVQTLQNGGTEPVYNHSVPVSSASLSSCGTPSPSKPKQKPTWRCEVCDYETNVARNLRIHMTSEKHMHNMMLLQQNMKQIQHNLHLGLAPAEAELYQYYLAQNIGLTGMKLENPADQQMMISPFQLDPTAAAALAPGLVNNELPPEIRLASGQLMGDDLSVLSAGELSPYISDPLLKLFQCAVCNKFTSDSLEALSVHVNAERSLPEEEWRAVIGDIYQCKLCNYNTQLKANFQLHCKTDKHMQKYQLVAHIKEGGKPNQWRLKCIAIGNPVHLKCNACDYYSNSVEKLRLHAANQKHETALKLYKHLQKQESALNPESCYYYCALCDYSTKAKLNLVQHLRSVRHQQTEGLRKLQLHQQGLPSDEDNLADLFFVKDCPPNEPEPARHSEPRARPAM